jgi:hypothetical protein
MKWILILLFCSRILASAYGQEYTGPIDLSKLIEKLNIVEVDSTGTETIRPLKIEDWKELELTKAEQKELYKTISQQMEIDISGGGGGGPG